MMCNWVKALRDRAMDGCLSEPIWSSLSHLTFRSFDSVPKKWEGGGGVICFRFEYSHFRGILVQGHDVGTVRVMWV